MAKAGDEIADGQDFVAVFVKPGRYLLDPLGTQKYIFAVLVEERGAQFLPNDISDGCPDCCAEKASRMTPSR